MLIECLAQHMADRDMASTETAKATLEAKELSLNELLALRTHCTQSKKSLVWTNGVFDVLLFGNESADSGGFQVGVRVARALDRPIVNGIKGISLTDGVVTARRECSDGYEVYRLALPAVLGVKEGINLPRYATLPGRLRSKKADVTHENAETAPGSLTTTSLATPTEQVVHTVMLGEGAGAASAVVDLLLEMGLA